MQTLPKPLSASADGGFDMTAMIRRACRCDLYNKFFRGYTCRHWALEQALTAFGRLRERLYAPAAEARAA